MKKKRDCGRFQSMIGLPKIYRTMKLICLFLFVALIQVSASTYSQNTKISVSGNNLTIEEVFGLIEDQSEFSFFYNVKQLDLSKRVNVDINNEQLEKVMEVVLAGTDITYSINNRLIIIHKKNGHNPLEKMAQQKPVRGTVSDEDGQPLPGVTVVVKGTTQGTITDANGNYSISEVSDDATLIFSFVGMRRQEIIVGSQTRINITLIPESIGLGEVIAIGYGTINKSDLTGSVSSVNNKNFNRGIIQSPEQLIQGKLSGVHIIQNSGQPGSNFAVRIRGGSSITAGNDPLYVIDGVPVGFSADNFNTITGDRMTVQAENPLNMLNPSDIESVDVLKDASATAIYGSRGANGVIMITTKKGKEGVNTIDYESYFGISVLRKKLPIASASQYREYLNANSSIIENIDDGGTSTDWQNEIFRMAPTHSHSLALNGGSTNTNYRASFSYINQEGIIISSGIEKITARFNINHKAFNDRLNININFTNGATNSDNVPVVDKATGDEIGGIIRDALRFNPTYPVKDKNGEYSFYSVFVQNPVAEAEQIQDETHTYRALGNASVDFKLTDYLKFNTNIGITKENIERKYYAPKSSKIGEDYGGRASQQIRRNTSRLIETTLLFNKDFGDIHNISALAGYSWQQFVYENALMRSENFITDATSFNNLDGGLTYYPPNTSKFSNKLISFYGRFNYNLHDKYLVTFTLRYDGSSRFGDNEKWGSFPSAAVAWRVSEEDFLKDNTVLSNLKFRVGYGVTGNQEIGNYKYLPTLSAGSNKYMFGNKVVTAVGPNQNYNPDLKWESTEQTNIGIDYGFFNGRINGSIDYYVKNTNDLLLSFTVPSPAEVTSILANVGSVQNKGFEFDINTDLLKSKNVKWNAYANLSVNRNKVISLSNNLWSTEEIYTDIIPVPGFTAEHPKIIRPGEPLGSFYGYDYIGVNEDGEQQFRDINGDGEITPGEDKVVIGNSQPDFTYGFGSNIIYRRFNLGFFFEGVQGVDVFNATAIDIQTISTLPGQNTLVEAFTDGIAFGESAIFSSKWIQDASFLRLNNISLGYNLDVSKIAWIKKANIFFNAQNVFVITGYKGFDPEVNSIDFTTYPRPRTLTLGVRLQF